MPVVLTDYTNRVWCVEQPDDGLLHVGTTGTAGPALQDVLDFIQTRQKQFDKFIEKKREKENANKRSIRHPRRNPRDAEGRGNTGAGEE